MEIITLFNQVAGENTYLLSYDEGIIVIDPGSDGNNIVTHITNLKKPVLAILLTHTHYDHIMSLDLVREQFNHPPVYVSKKEAHWLYTPTSNLSGLDRHNDIPDVITKPADQFFETDKVYDLGGSPFRVVETPGHSIGGVSFIFDKDEFVISGDALFRETIGRTDLPTGNFDTLITGIKQNLFTLPNHYKVYPGHGRSTTIGHEKNFNPFFK